MVFKVQGPAQPGAVGFRGLGVLGFVGLCGQHSLWFGVGSSGPPGFGFVRFRAWGLNDNRLYGLLPSAPRII